MVGKVILIKRKSLFLHTQKNTSYVGMKKTFHGTTLIHSTNGCLMNSVDDPSLPKLSNLLIFRRKIKIVLLFIGNGHCFVPGAI